MSTPEPFMQPPAPNPCNECPWRRESVPGFLGPHTAEEWVEIAHSDADIACHKTIPPGTPEDGSDLDEMTACAGAAIFRANVFKRPRHLRDKPEFDRQRDTVRVFAWNDEFINHHEGRQS